MFYYINTVHVCYLEKVVRNIFRCRWNGRQVFKFLDSFVPQFNQAESFVLLDFIFAGKLGFHFQLVQTEIFGSRHFVQVRKLSHLVDKKARKLFVYCFVHSSLLPCQVSFYSYENLNNISWPFVGYQNLSTRGETYSSGHSQVEYFLPRKLSYNYDGVQSLFCVTVLYVYKCSLQKRTCLLLCDLRMAAV